MSQPQLLQSLTCIVVIYGMGVHKYIPQSVETQTCCQTSPEGIQMAINKSDCCVGHKMEKCKRK